MARIKKRKPVAKIDEIVNSVPKIKASAIVSDGTTENRPKIAPTTNQKTKPFP